MKKRRGSAARGVQAGKNPSGSGRQTGRKRVKSFVASCWFLLERPLTRLAHDEIHFTGFSTSSDA